MAAPLIDDPRVRMVTFTGSARVGWAIRQRAFTKRVTLELGGNAAVIIEPDADLDHAVRRCVSGGYLYAGQSCISTQRILVHESLYEAFTDRLVAAVGALRTGDPMEESTAVGPMIDDANAARAVEWIAEAVSAGARLAVGGARDGAVLQPTVLLDTTGRMRVNCEEVFAPVTTVRPYADFDAAHRRGERLAVRNPDRSLHLRHAADPARVRAARGGRGGGERRARLPGRPRPYGGVKASGLGREGVRYAMEEMTELRLLVLGDH